MIDMDLSLPLLSLILIFSFLVALYSIIYAFKEMDQKSNQPTNNINNISDPKGKTKSKTQYKPQFLNSVKNIDLDL
ncbi:MAG: hypothetical protein EBW93_01245 [Betaproteobacteria bacterium]|nr:hypothetical protein [Betaproteobacteria bacterium]